MLIVLVFCVRSFGNIVPFFCTTKHNISQPLLVLGFRDSLDCTDNAWYSFKKVIHHNHWQILNFPQNVSTWTCIHLFL